VLQKSTVTTLEVITIYKQSGISATSYEIVTPNSSQQFNLLQDTNIAL
ncbi:MAG: hypothetical protein QG639_49, partial [Patescibacteria group bacterium]|nr:hypothetical protein [Patescibacteria group bacterium]